MGIELYWDNDEQTVMLCEIAGAWTWDEMFATFDNIEKVTARLDHNVDAIIDVRDGATVPGGSIFTPTTFQNAKAMLKRGENGTGAVVIVGANRTIKSIYDTINGWGNKTLNKVSFADNVDAARTILAHRHAQPTVSGFSAAQATS
ncbi:MAG: hypothetical protein GYB67_01820 [Chloroflexi bacterium]|nr:hypothetical protein [Chloroflexota bacterium]